MSWSRTVTLSCVFLMSNGALAATPCETARLASLTLNELTQYKDLAEQDLCQLAPAQLRPELKALIAQVGALNKKVAAFFNLSPTKLLPKGVNLVIQGNEQGFLSSAAEEAPDLESAGTLIMTVFADWKGELLNPGVYVHELGHVVSLSPNPAFPSAFQLGANSVLVIEGIADTLSLAIEGRVLSPDPKLPQCFSELRVIEPDRSFKEADGFFSPQFLSYKLQKCCDETHVSQHTPNSQAVCDQLNANLKENPLPELKTKEFAAGDMFDPELAVLLFKEEKDGVYSFTHDAHQLGIPFNSFLVDLSMNFNRDGTARSIPVAREKSESAGQRYFLDTLFKSPEAQLRKSYRCYLNAPGVQKKPTKVEVFGVTEVFKNMIRRIPLKDREAFMAIWNRHEMNTSLEITQRESYVVARSKALPILAEQIGWKHPCYEKLMSPTKRHADCSVNCDLMK